MRDIRAWYDPYSQTKGCVTQLQAIGHSQGTVFMGIGDSIPSEGGITFS
jgi:histone acetyltransferase (RNA polymerase elongator complex component)